MFSSTAPDDSSDLKFSKPILMWAVPLCQPLVREKLREKSLHGNLSYELVRRLCYSAYYEVIRSRVTAELRGPLGIR